MSQNECEMATHKLFRGIYYWLFLLAFKFKIMNINKSLSYSEYTGGRVNGSSVIIVSPTDQVVDTQEERWMEYMYLY